MGMDSTIMNLIGLMSIKALTIASFMGQIVNVPAMIQED